MARLGRTQNKKKKAPHLRAVNPDESAQPTGGDETPWKTIILVTVATTVAGQIVIDFYRALKKKALKSPEENPDPHWQERQLAAPQAAPPQHAVGPSGNPGGYGMSHAPLYAQASAPREQQALQQAPPTAWQQQPAAPPPQQNGHQMGPQELQSWEDRLRRWEKELEDEHRQFRMMQGP